MNTPEPLRALSLWQPWAQLVAVGAKRYETRSWPTAHRGWLAIHASSHWTRDTAALCGQIPFKLHCADLTRLDTCLIVAVVQVVDCLPAAQVRAQLTTEGLKPDPDVCEPALEELEFGDYTAGRWAWQLSAPLRLRRPITASGRQGFWFPTATATQLIRAELAESSTI